jgi:hypothetical protein
MGRRSAIDEIEKLLGEAVVVRGAPCLIMPLSRNEEEGLVLRIGINEPQTDFAQAIRSVSIGEEIVAASALRGCTEE